MCVFAHNEPGQKRAGGKQRKHLRDENEWSDRVHHLNFDELQWRNIVNCFDPAVRSTQIQLLTMRIDLARWKERIVA